MDAISKHLQITLCAAVLLGAVSASAQQPAPVPADAPYKQSTLPIEIRVHDLVSRMTVQEKARQLDMYRGVSASTGRDADKAPPSSRPTASSRRPRKRPSAPSASAPFTTSTPPAPRTTTFKPGS